MTRGAAGTTKSMYHTIIDAVTESYPTNTSSPLEVREDAPLTTAPIWSPLQRPHDPSLYSEVRNPEPSQSPRLANRANIVSTSKPERDQGATWGVSHYQLELMDLERRKKEAPGLASGSLEQSPPPDPVPAASSSQVFEPAANPLREYQASVALIEEQNRKRRALLATSGPSAEGPGADAVSKSASTERKTWYRLD